MKDFMALIAIIGASAISSAVMLAVLYFTGEPWLALAAFISCMLYLTAKWKRWLK